MHWSGLYGCKTNTKCLEFCPAMWAASMAPADARVSESITKNSTRAFSLARCSSSIRSGVQSDTCYTHIWKDLCMRITFCQMEQHFSGADQSVIPDYKMRFPARLVPVWQHRLAMLSDYMSRPKILPVHSNRMSAVFPVEPLVRQLCHWIHFVHFPILCVWNWWPLPQSSQTPSMKIERFEMHRFRLESLSASYNCCHDRIASFDWCAFENALNRRPAHRIHQTTNRLCACWTCLGHCYGVRIIWLSEAFHWLHAENLCIFQFIWLKTQLMYLLCFSVGLKFSSWNRSWSLSAGTMLHLALARHAWSASLK